MASEQSGEVSSLLTAAQREFLRGSSDIDDGSSHARAMRARIRSRLRSCLTDFTLLRRLEDRDRIEVFRAPDDTEAFDINPTVGALPDAIAFLYLGVADQYPEPEQADRAFANIVRNGITGAVSRQGGTVEHVTVNIEIERGDPLPDPEEHPLSEMRVGILRQLLTADQITPDEFADEIQRRKEE